MSDPVALAAEAQRRASDPSVSAFVSASAGSGKTKLLIDRLLRLMLPGPGREPTSPERILCLTFTKAGAAEMAIRLRRVLGEWVIAEDPVLDAALKGVGLEPSGPLRDAARALFARVLDIPGGLRIGTIHAFCEQLLRRFPLEASISPYFRLVEETDSQSALDRARERSATLSDAAGAVSNLAARLDTLGHAKLTRDLQARTDRLVHAHSLDPASLAASLGEVLEIVHADEDKLIAASASGHAAALAGTLRTILAEAPASIATKAETLLAWLGLDAAERQRQWPRWRDLLLTADGKPRSLIPSNTKLFKSRPDLVEILRAECERVLAVEGHRSALATIEATAALLALSGPSLAAYAEEKQALGLLDFDDLIRRTRDLLADPGVAWVLFKLDGGIDHLLLDEVQDTSAAQWAIAGKLTEEFFAGATASDAGRTIFAVGDFKQSIYSFQGADPQGFRLWRDVFRTRVQGAGKRFEEPSLTVSFRSSPAILRFVDAVFADLQASAGVADPGLPVPPHSSARPSLSGQVELWPLVSGDEGAAPDSPWDAPDENRGLASGEQRLADALASHLASLIAAGEVRAGEILILVRRRTRFAGMLMRALKGRDVPVAGLDRIVLAAQPAVQDLLALCDALLMPDDDLSLAIVLTSPLGGLDDPSLMALAMERDGTLWSALQRRCSERPDWQAAHDFFARLLARADFITPHALLSEALGRGGAHARLLARFGPEASESTNELLAAALAHGRTRVPSLQGFVQWVRQSGSDIKREPGEAADEVRLMTVHGSKGLEARLVVLADTTGLPKAEKVLLWSEQDGKDLPIWAFGSDTRWPPIERLRDAAFDRAIEEANRLLYVGLTRAKQRLIVCGWRPRGEVDPRCWYAHCERAMTAIADAETRTFEPPVAGGAWRGALRVLAQDGNESSPPARSEHQHKDAMPAWAGRAPGWQSRPPPAEPDARRSLIPSRPDGVAFGPVPPAASPRSVAGRFDRLRRGEVLHALLQVLPDLPDAERPEAARRYARRRLDAGVEHVVEEALAVIAHPMLARVFGPLGRPEQRVAGLVGNVAVSGVVDRIAIGPGFIDLVDFKSGRPAPADPARIPVRYLRQMSAYRGLLQALRPADRIRCALVWTEDATVTHLPDEWLDANAPAVA